MAMRSRALWLSTAACLLVACDGSDEAGDRGDPDAPVRLWRLDPGGLSDVPNPFEGGRGSDRAGSSGGDEPSLSQLDPEQVYIFGTLSEGTCGLDAIAPVDAPDDALVGFPCEAQTSGAAVRPSDGSMLYVDGAADTGVYAFRCDGCSAARVAIDYPDEPLANDVRQPTTACGSEGVAPSFFVTADSELITVCVGGVLYDADQQPIDAIPIGPQPLSFGFEHTVLMADGVIDLATGERLPLVGLDRRDILAVRARADGYWVAVHPVGDSATPPELWQVAFDGTATLLGSYPGPPAEQFASFPSKLDGEGRLVQFASYATIAFRDTIIRRSVDGESAVIYDEADAPVVMLHISGLFTGP